jgi:hypothetical protein
MNDRSRKILSTSGLLSLARTSFDTIKDKSSDWKKRKTSELTRTDCLMSGLAIFSLKYESLLQFDNHYNSDELVQENLRSLYGVKQVPSDTYMRERLDEIDPKSLRKSFKAIFAQAQRGKALEQFIFMNDHYLMPIDGTGFFSSTQVHCDNCCVKNHNDGTKTYYHQMLGAAIVHPSQKTVIPFAPEPIMKSDGSNKNDCEFNAIKRFIADFRREHPHLKVIATMDGLSSKAPCIKLLKENNMSFILGAKPGDHKFLFDFLDQVGKKIEIVEKNKTIRHYRYANNQPLNDSNPNVRVNILEYTETSPKGKKLQFSWVTDISITPDNVQKIMEGGRARWKIENETFNTLKNQGYNFEHNFGHGYKYLSTVFAMLMMLAFMIDQIQELCDALFQKALLKKKRKKYLWEKLRGLFNENVINCWEDVWNAMIHGKKKMLLVPNST